MKDRGLRFTDFDVSDLGGGTLKGDAPDIEGMHRLYLRISELKRSGKLTDEVKVHLREDGRRLSRGNADYVEHMFD